MFWEWAYLWGSGDSFTAGVFEKLLKVFFAAVSVERGKSLNTVQQAELIL